VPRSDWVLARSEPLVKNARRTPRSRPCVLFRDSWLWDGELWTQVEDIGPSGRTGHAVAYDSARSRVVLFGGLNASGEPGDTWEWDGGSWTQLEDTGPSARARHALAYDSIRSRVVLFGGEGAGGPLGDTWEWNGDEWTQVADTRPSPRRGHAMCFESPANWTVLFGGSNGSDTWTSNGTAWTELNDIGPPPSEGLALAYTGQSTLLFGGLGRGPNASLSGLTWELVGTDWADRQDMGPTPRFGHAMAYDGTRGRVVLFGGSGAFPTTAGSLVGDTWELPAGGQAAPGVARLAWFNILPSSVSSLPPPDLVQFQVAVNPHHRASRCPSIGRAPLGGVRRQC
jgi:Galactose oxidase, central domain